MISRLLKIGFSVLGVLVVIFLAINAYIVLSAQSSLYTVIGDVPAKQAALVLGAQVRGNTASAILNDRLVTAAELYKTKKAQKILVSGDHGSKYYDEVDVMRKNLLAQGIPPHDIFMDHAGFDTYDSVYRAREIFGVESVIIVSQTFHLPRALFIAKALGVDAVGMSANRQEYRWSTIIRNNARESLARIKALGDVLRDAKPTYLGEPIPITGDGTVTNTK